MSRFFGFVRKEFRHIFRDYRTMLILFGMPVAQILIFGYVISNEINDVKIAILDKSKDNVTQEITHKILSSGFFILDENLHSDEQIKEIFQKGDVREVVIFEPNFATKLEKEGKASVQIIADASDANTANIVANYTSAIIRSYMKNELMEQDLPYEIVPEIQILYNKELKGVYMFVPGTMALILMLVSAMMTSISITREKETGTMEVLLVSPLKSFQVIIGKVTPYVLLAFINGIVIIALGYFVFEMPVKGSLVLLLSVTLLYIIMSLSLGILISTVSNSQEVAMFVSMFALMLPTLLLSNFIFPVENMPWPLQWLSTIIPAKYFVTLIKGIMIKGTGLAFVWKEIVILLLFTSIFITASIRKFKIRLE